MSSPCLSSLLLFSSTMDVRLSAAGGGLGGPFALALLTTRSFFGDLFSEFFSSEVRVDDIEEGRSSLLLTASRACAFERLGYGKLTLLSFDGSRDGRRVSSGTGAKPCLFKSDAPLDELRLYFLRPSFDPSLSTSSSRVFDVFRLGRSDLCFLRSLRSGLPSRFTLLSSVDRGMASETASTSSRVFRDCDQSEMYSCVRPLFVSNCPSSPRSCESNDRGCK